MMPHPEAFNIPENCPYWVRGTIKEGYGLRIFKNAVEFMKNFD
jgi:phosphoribosylformylglycinamidine (FGAM) synthase-like amidotransferase family enzyme